jgi:glycerol-3-phosphate acyltransferase PlsX
VRIAVDAMGGDQGPQVVVEGALQAVGRGPSGLELILVGREEEIRRALGGAEVPSVRVVHASEVIGMSEAPAAAVRKKKDSSIAVGTRLVKQGQADGFVSAGNTGAVVASSLVNMGRLAGVSRPAIATLWPSTTGGAVVLDVGANYECVPKNLVQFAVMGTVYARYHLGVERPRVGLLNIGEERSKGNDLVRESYSLLEAESAINFVGNVEGRDVFNGAADVVVCDGFVGNVILKFSESIFSFLSHMVRDEIRRGVVAKAGALLMRGAFSNVRAQLDYAEYGGAPLLGVNGVTIISHGKSSERAIKNAILAAARTVTEQVNGHIEASFKGPVGHVAEVS